MAYRHDVFVLVTKDDLKATTPHTRRKMDWQKRGALPEIEVLAEAGRPRQLRHLKRRLHLDEHSLTAARIDTRAAQTQQQLDNVRNQQYLRQSGPPASFTGFVLS